jgi:hypothetical protein
MKTKHTPGPWNLKQTHTPGPWCIMDNVIYSDDDTAVCMITSYRDMTPRQAANARLIASAPALLEALQWALAQIEDDLDLDHQAALAKAQAAIAKATGE